MIVRLAVLDCLLTVLIYFQSEGTLVCSPRIRNITQSSLLNPTYVITEFFDCLYAAKGLRKWYPSEVLLMHSLMSCYINIQASD